MLNSIKQNWRALFFVAVLLIALPSQLILRLAPWSPCGIVSLELACSQNRADSIRKNWTDTFQVYNPLTDKKDAHTDFVWQAEENTFIDFVFILSYGLLLMGANTRVNALNVRKKKIVGRLILLACCFDVVEDIGMLLLLYSTPVHPYWLFFIPASLKFILLIVVLLWGIDGWQWIVTQLRGFTRWVRDFFYIFRISPLTLISILAMYFFIWASDQGQDILLLINDTWLGPVFLHIVVIILALMNWHFPKIFHKKIPEGSNTRDLFRKEHSADDVAGHGLDLPRLLGAITFLIPAFGMLNVLDIFGLNFRLDFLSSSTWMLITIVLVQLCFAKNVFTSLYTNHNRLFRIVCWLLFLAPFSFVLFNHHEPHDIIWLFWGLLAYGFLFCLLTANREAIAKKLKLFGDTAINRLIWVCVIFPVLLFGFYFFCNIIYSKGFPVRFLAFSVAMSAIITYYGLFTILTYYGKIVRVNLSIILVVVMAGITFSMSNNFHYIDVRPGATPAIKPQKLEAYIETWLKDRVALKTASDGYYHIYLVNTYGGGIRASAWTCLAMNKLDSLVRSRDTGAVFQSHVLAYSGASGGTVGASILCANGFNQKRNPVLSDSDYCAFFGNDYLTAVITGLLGNDIWYSGLHITSGSDRSKVQEHLWQQYYSKHFNDTTYATNIGNLWDGIHTTVPLLFSNSTDVTFGRKAICAPVALNAGDFIGATIVDSTLTGGKALKLSTAAFLSARFPYLSPAGAFNGGHNILDGGMVDNAGAETAMQLYRVLKRVIDAHDTFKNHFKVSVISLKNSYLLEDATDTLKHKNIAQLTAPITALTNVGVEGNTKKNEAINKAYFTNNAADALTDGYWLIQPVAQKLPVVVKPWFGKEYVDSAIVPLPLGWSISDLALARMEASVDTLCQPGWGLHWIVFGY